MAVSVAMNFVIAKDSHMALVIVTTQNCLLFNSVIEANRHSPLIRMRLIAGSQVILAKQSCKYLLKQLYKANNNEAQL